MANTLQDKINLCNEGLTIRNIKTDRDELVDWLCKPFQAPGAHVADYSNKPVKTGEGNSVMRVCLDLVECLHVGVA